MDSKETSFTIHEESKGAYHLAKNPEISLRVDSQIKQQFSGKSVLKFKGSPLFLFGNSTPCMSSVFAKFPSFQSAKNNCKCLSVI